MNKLMKTVFCLLTVAFLLSVQLYSQSKLVMSQVFKSKTEQDLSRKQLKYYQFEKEKKTVKRSEVFEFVKTQTELDNVSSISMDIFDELVNFDIKEIQTNNDGSIFLVGFNEKYEFFMTIDGCDVTASILIDDKTYAIVPLGHGMHSFLEIDQSKYKNESEPIFLEGASKDNNDILQKSIQTSSSNSSDIDILVAYTPAANSAVSNMSSLVNTAISLANSSFSSCGINVTYHVVCLAEVDIDESNKTHSQILDIFDSNSTVLSLRNEYRADLCFLITNSSTVSGSTWEIFDPTPYSSYKGFSIGNYDYVRDNKTFSHETGHTFGATHNIEVISHQSYNHGHLNEAADFCTIMSYPSNGDFSQRKNIWSDPNETWGVHARGIVDTSENVRWINEQREDVESYRTFQTSGTISSNHHWRRDITLTGNLTINGELTIESDCSVNLNGYSIVCSSGSINLEYGMSISPNIRLKSGSTIKGFFPSITSALAASSIGQTIEVYGSHTISSDLSVPSGITLKPMSGSSINIAAGKKLIVNGNLSADNVTFTKSGTSAWYGIVYETGSSGTIQNCNITNADYGIYCKSSTPDIKDNTFSNNTYALYIYNSSPDIESNRVTNDLVYLNNSSSYMDDNYFSNASGAYCLKIYSSSPVIYNHTITGESSPGIAVDNGSMPFFGEAGYRGYNYVYNNGNTFTITANNSSDVILGTGTDAGPYYCGNNTILAGNDALGEAYASSNSQIDAKWCWWGQSTPPSLGANVTTDYALSSDPGGGSSLAKSVISNRNYDYIEDLPFNSEADSLLNLALNLLKNDDSKGAKSILKTIIKKFPDMHYAHKALFQILRVDKKEKNTSSRQDLEDLLKEVKKSEISVAIRNRIISDDRQQKDFKNAITNLKEIKKQFPKSEYEYYALFDLYNIYQKDIYDLNLATSTLEELKTNYPDMEYTLIAQYDAGEEISDLVGKRNIPEEDFKNIGDSSVGLFDAFPNPFNPETTISYQLPKQSNVSINVYDMTGRLVKILVKESNKPQGYYHVKWNAGDLSSGVYFYQINACGVTQVKKCLLVK